jgi:hypothetical protein
MRFLVDAQLPPALARWLAAEGHEPSISPTGGWNRTGRMRLGGSVRRQLALAPQEGVKGGFRGATQRGCGYAAFPERFDSAQRRKQHGAKIARIR